MDDRGRLAQPLRWIARWRLPRVGGRAARRERAFGAAVDGGAEFALPHFGPSQRWANAILKMQPPRGVGVAIAVLMIAGSVGYGVIRGDHVPATIEALRDARDQAANMLGFNIASVAVTGERHISREDVLAAAGISGRMSLLFLDVETARARLKANPWIADATVLKLYPNQLQIGIKEREAFAIWQKEGRVSVIADDGTVLDAFIAPYLMRLPLVVGQGAAARAKEFLAMLDRHPQVRELVRASILIGERRWNLRLRNGIDVRLPEAGVEPALERLAALDKDVKLTTRDITIIDLRLPDRVTVRQSPAAAQERTGAAKDNKKPKKKGGAA